MTKPAIKVEGLCKEYVVGSAQQAHSTFYDLLSHSLKAPFKRMRNLGGTNDEVNRFWALKDVNFEVNPGEVLGVIGRNGAGKSTLLKILSRITAPTSGRVTVQGRMASLLEVGTGFHPELSGRENIYLNATILGMTQKEVARKFDAIVDFSGVEKFLDTPVKRYSSGMYVRLAFAVAAHVEADILLVDEVLAVGDAEFQKRCMGMMGDVARGGRTVLFVSHNLTALRNLCTTGLLLQGGQVDAFGNIGDVLNQYATGRGGNNDGIVELTDTHATKVACVRRVAVLPLDESRNSPLSVTSSFKISVQVEVRKPETAVGVFLSCFDSNQNRVFSTGSFFNAELNDVKLGAGLHDFACIVPAHLLNNDQYSLDVSLILNRNEVILEESAVVSFNVQDDAVGVDGWHWPILGIIRPELHWSIK